MEKLLDKYRRLLGEKDWSYNYADDHSAWRRGSDRHKELVAISLEVDPDYKIWNSYAPTEYQLRLN